VPQFISIKPEVDESKAKLLIKKEDPWAQQEAANALLSEFQQQYEKFRF